MADGATVRRRRRPLGGQTALRPGQLDHPDLHHDPGSRLPLNRPLGGPAGGWLSHALLIRGGTAGRPPDRPHRPAPRDAVTVGSRPSGERTRVRVTADRRANATTVCASGMGSRVDVSRQPGRSGRGGGTGTGPSTKFRLPISVYATPEPGGREQPAAAALAGDVWSRWQIRAGQGDREQHVARVRPERPGRPGRLMAGRRRRPASTGMAVPRAPDGPVLVRTSGPADVGHRCRDLAAWMSRRGPAHRRGVQRTVGSNRWPTTWHAPRWTGTPGRRDGRPTGDRAAGKPGWESRTAPLARRSVSFGSALAAGRVRRGRPRARRGERSLAAGPTADEEAGRLEDAEGRDC